MENGELLRRAAEAGFDVLITNDRGLEYEQNLATLPLAVVVIVAKANTIESIRPCLDRLHDALNTIRPGQLIRVGP